MDKLSSATNGEWKPIEDIDEALAAIPTKDELDVFFFNGTPPRWVNFGLEYRHKVKELAKAGLTVSDTRSETEFFIAPRPLPREVATVLAEYDLILAKADLRDPEWDFVMRAADWAVIREFFAKLKPGGPPTVITNPPRPA